LEVLNRGNLGVAVANRTDFLQSEEVSAVAEGADELRIRRGKRPAESALGRCDVGG
jgi:hypothetical protein